MRITLPICGTSGSYDMSLVNLRSMLEQRETGLPEYVPKLLKFWAAWMHGIKMPHLDYPSENTISKIKRLRDGAGQPTGFRDISTLSDAIGLAVDRAVEDLSMVDYRMSAAIIHCYYHDLSSREACKRIHTSVDVYDDILKMARWYMVSKLEPWKGMV